MNRENIKNQMSESFILASLLTVIGGFLDSYTYYCRDKVFANAQTGNVVKIGMSLADGEFIKIFRYLLPIIAFSIGILITMYIKDNNKTNIYWKQIILLFEAAIIIIVSFMPIKTNLNIISNIMISFLCAMQSESFKKVLGNPFSSTMCTGNLRKVMEDLYSALKNKDMKSLKNAKYYFIIILFFILGAAIGRLSSYYLLEKSILLALIPLLFSSIIIEDNFLKKRKELYVISKQNRKCESNKC